MSVKTTTVASSRNVATPVSERRVSIWSVPVDLGPWFYLFLVMHTAPLVFLLWWTDDTPKTNDNIANIIVNVTSGAAPLIIVAEVTKIIELEVLVVLREWYRDHTAKTKEKARQEGRQEGRKEGRQEGYRDGFKAGRKAERDALRSEAKRNGKDQD